MMSARTKRNREDDEINGLLQGGEEDQVVTLEEVLAAKKRDRAAHRSAKKQPLNDFQQLRQLIIKDKHQSVEWIGEYTTTRHDPQLSCGFLRNEAMALVAFLRYYRGGETSLPLCKYDPSCYRKNPEHRRQYAHTVPLPGATTPSVTSVKGYRCPISLVFGETSLGRKLAIFHHCDPREKWYRYYRTSIENKPINLSVVKLSMRSLGELAQLGRANWFLETLRSRIKANVKSGLQTIPWTADLRKMNLASDRVEKMLGITSGQNELGASKLSDDIRDFLLSTIRMGQVDVIRILVEYFRLPDLGDLLREALSSLCFAGFKLLYEMGNVREIDSFKSSEALTDLFIHACNARWWSQREESKDTRFISEVLDYLTGLGLDIDKPGRVYSYDGARLGTVQREGVTPLMQVSLTDSIECAKFLIGKGGARVTDRDDLKGSEILANLFLAAVRRLDMKDMKWVLALVDELDVGEVEGIPHTHTGLVFFKEKLLTRDAIQYCLYTALSASVTAQREHETEWFQKTVYPAIVAKGVQPATTPLNRRYFLDTHRKTFEAILKYFVDQGADINRRDLSIHGHPCGTCFALTSFAPYFAQYLIEEWGADVSHESVGFGSLIASCCAADDEDKEKTSAMMVYFFELARKQDWFDDELFQKQLTVAFQNLLIVGDRSVPQWNHFGYYSTGPTKRTRSQRLRVLVDNGVKPWFHPGTSNHRQYEMRLRSRSVLWPLLEEGDCESVKILLRETPAVSDDGQTELRETFDSPARHEGCSIIQLAIVRRKEKIVRLFLDDFAFETEGDGAATTEGSRKKMKRAKLVSILKAAPKRFQNDAALLEWIDELF